MSRTEAAFLVLLGSGILSLLAGLMLTRRHWRPELPPYGRSTRFLEVALHPEAFVASAPVRTIRLLNVTGGVLLLGAAIAVAYETLRTTLAP